jgi:GAF domain-containing protein
VRTNLLLPLRKDDTLLGVISCNRGEVRPFSDNEIAVLENFAAQAVIAIENARLITETREALEQQTATSEVLQVINSSPGDLAPVFDAMLDKATRLCEAAFGVLSVVTDGGLLAHRSFSGRPEAAEFLRGSPPVRPGPRTTMGRLLAGENCVHVEDARDDDLYRSGDPGRRMMVDLAGARTLISLALRKDGDLLGAITLYREEVRPFSDKEVRLLENFAAQAVIAMENARLIAETREALEQQTATAEVLQVINSSPGDLAPVFDTMLEKATRLCEADFGTLWTFDGERFQPTVVSGFGNPAMNAMRAPIRPGPNISLGRLVGGESVVHVVDVAADEDYQSDAAARTRTGTAGARSILAIALRKDDTLLGAITTGRAVDDL